METAAFWEDRARQYAGDGAGLRAVCSYAMPNFYNRAIDLCQRRALRSLLASIPAEAEVLDYGCGVGRWTREMAARGARVTAVDFSATMLAEAARRSEQAGLGELCRFVQSDIGELRLPQRFDVIVGVTVLQHVVNDDDLASAIANLARHLKPAGRLIMVEAAPTIADTRCNTQTFRARPLAGYLAGMQAAGLTVVNVAGVDPMPFKRWVVPSFRRWPRLMALTLLALATALALPLDLLLARALARHSWHKVVVAVARSSSS